MVTIACSRPIEVPIDDTAIQTDRAPFRQVNSESTETAAPAAGEPSLTENGLPFRPQELPAGTLLRVRLEAAISGTRSDSFEGSIDEPVVIRGKTVIPQGTIVSGRVESASSSDVKPGRGYVRLALTSLRISGSDVPVRSASLFTRAHNPGHHVDPVIRLEKGHRLTFRLTEPLYSLTQTAQVAH